MAERVQQQLCRMVLVPAFLCTLMATFGCATPEEIQPTPALEPSATTRPENPHPRQDVPEPINLLLPRSLRLHPFTGTRTFDETGGIRGIDVRLQAIDAYGDPTKAFGDFRFELYRFVPNRLDPKGERMAMWEESLLDPKVNLLHWDNITKAYSFKLQWKQSIPVGERFVLAAVFASPFSPRLFDQRVFISGQ